MFCRGVCICCADCEFTEVIRAIVCRGVYICCADCACPGRALNLLVDPAVGAEHLEQADVGPDQVSLETGKNRVVKCGAIENGYSTRARWWRWWLDQPRDWRAQNPRAHNPK